VENQQSQRARLLTGAAISAGFAFLFFSKSGKQILDSAEPWLDEVIRDMQRLRGAAAKVRDAVDEGRRSFEAVSRLGTFGSDAQQPWTSEAKH